MLSPISNQRIKVGLVGDARVGKSSLMGRFINDTFTDVYSMTIGVDSEMRTMELREELVRLLIWDFAGHEQFRAVTTAFYRDNDTFLIVYDVSNRVTFNKVSGLFESIKKNINANVNPLVIILVGNKSDVDESSRVVSAEEGRELANQLGIPFFETSAKNGTNVEDVFLTLVASVRPSAIHPTPPPPPSLLQRLFS